MYAKAVVQMMNKVKFLMILDRQRMSGLSVGEFCGNEGYPVSTFYYWKRKFAPPPTPESTPASETSHTSRTDIRICSSKTFPAEKHPSHAGSAKGTE